MDDNEADAEGDVEDDDVHDAVDEQLSKVSVWIAHFFACLLFFEFIGTQG